MAKRRAKPRGTRQQSRAEWRESGGSGQHRRVRDWKRVQQRRVRPEGNRGISDTTGEERRRQATPKEPKTREKRQEERAPRHPEAEKETEEETAGGGTDRRAKGAERGGNPGGAGATTGAEHNAYNPPTCGNTREGREEVTGTAEGVGKGGAGIRGAGGREEETRATEGRGAAEDTGGRGNRTKSGEEDRRARGEIMRGLRGKVRIEGRKNTHGNPNPPTENTNAPATDNPGDKPNIEA